MITEVNLDGVFFSGVLLTAAIAISLLLAARWALQRAGFYALVWHRHLVDIALFVILWAVVTLGFQALTAGRPA